MNKQLDALGAFKYIKKELTKRNVNFEYHNQSYSSNKFCKGVSGSINLNYGSIYTHLFLDFCNGHPFFPTLEISFPKYFPSIKESRLEAGIDTLAKLFNVNREEIIISNYVQRIKDSKIYEMMECLKLLKTEVTRYEHNNLCKHFELTFKAGENFDNTCLVTKDLDLIVNMFDYAIY